MLYKPKLETSNYVLEENSILNYFRIGDYKSILRKIDKITSKKDFFQYIGALFGLGELAEIEKLLPSYHLYFQPDALTDLYIQFLKVRITFYKGNYSLGFSTILMMLRKLKNISSNDNGFERPMISKEKLEALLYKLYGENKITTHQLPEAVTYLVKAKNIFTQKNEYIEAEGWVRHSLGRVYILQKELDKATEEIKISLQIRELIGNSHHIALSLNLLGAIQEKKGYLDDALDYFNKALSFASFKKGHYYILSALYNNIALIQMRKGDLINAKDNLLHALSTGNYGKKEQEYLPELKSEILTNLKVINDTLKEINSKILMQNKVINVNPTEPSNPRDIEKQKQIQLIIEIIKDNPLGIYQKALPKLTNLSKATISRRVNELLQARIISLELVGTSNFLTYLTY